MKPALLYHPKHRGGGQPEGLIGPMLSRLHDGQLLPGLGVQEHHDDENTGPGKSADGCRWASSMRVHETCPVPSHPLSGG